MKRKEFIKLSSTAALGIASLGYQSFSKPKDLFFKLSLAQWSLHRNIKYGNMNPYKFAEFAINNNFSGIEYVTTLYEDVMSVRNADMVRAITFWARKNKELSDQNNIKNVLIMIDEFEALADPNQSNRIKAIENHKMWIDAEEKRNNYVPIEVHYTQVPGRDDKWRQETIKNTSEQQFNQEFLCEFLGSTRTLIDASKYLIIAFL